MLIIAPIIVPISGSSRSLTDSEVNTLIGFYIILNLLWVITSIYAIYKWKYKDKCNDYILEATFVEYYFLGKTIFLINGIMASFNGILFLLYLGSIIGNFLIS